MHVSNLIRQHIKHPIANITLIAQTVDKRQLHLIVIMYGIYDNYNGIKIKLSDHSLLLRYSNWIQDFLNGKVRGLNRIKLSFDGYTDFQKRVLNTARTIPWGRTVSYKELAEMAGHPKAVRAVANVMRQNRFPLVIPCHRVIRNDGSIGGFGGQTSGHNIILKRKFLEMEGISL